MSFVEKDEIVHLSWAWDKEKTNAHDRIQTHDAFYRLLKSCELNTKQQSNHVSEKSPDTKP